MPRVRPVAASRAQLRVAASAEDISYVMVKPDGVQVTHFSVSCSHPCMQRPGIALSSLVLGPSASARRSDVGGRAAWRSVPSGDGLALQSSDRDARECPWRGPSTPGQPANSTPVSPRHLLTRTTLVACMHVHGVQNSALLCSARRDTSRPCGSADL